MSALAAWLTFAIIIVAKFAGEALPLAYLGRPLIVAVGVAALIGLVSLLVGRLAAPVAAALAFFIALASALLALLLTLILVTALVANRILMRSGRRIRLDATEATLIPLGLLLTMALLRPASRIDLAEFQVGPLEESGPRIVVVLLDGYPRGDGLAELGIDNSAFEAELAARGFDVNSSATTTYTYTNKTLLAMLSDVDVEDGAGSVDEKREIRHELSLPTGYLVISPPVGHVTLVGGPRIDPSVVNDFDAHLLGQSIFGQLAPAWSGRLLMDGLRYNVAQAFVAIESADARRILAHVMVPHPPFLYSASGTPLDAPACWPNSCHIFDSTIEHLGISRDEWATGMGGQIANLNLRVLTLLDRLLEADPDSVIVLFSDHGGRYTTDEPDEWHRSFLAARTPRVPDLFDDVTGPEDIFRILEEAYSVAQP